MKLLLGDCLDKLKDLEDNSVDAVVTDPPYGLSFMGKKWDYDVPSEDIWREVLRVLKPGGYLLSFAGTRTQHRMAVRIEDAGFEIRDMIAWVYGSGFPKSHNIGKSVDKFQGNEREEIEKETKADSTNHTQNVGETIVNTSTYSVTKGNSEWEGWGTALKPALEPITVARKPLEKGLNVAQNCLKWGTGGINIDGCRVGNEVLSEHKSGNTPNDRGEWGLKEGYVMPERTGRFPANLIHDGSDEVISLFPNDNQRFFYCAKASKKERNKGCERLEEKISPKEGSGLLNEKGEEKFSESKMRNSHPTVKPIALMEYLVKLVSREGAVVLDPFMGSGSTGVACKKLNRNFIGIELNEDYLEIAKRRIENTEVQKTL